MEIYIILALVLALLQIWIIPMVLNLNNFDWLLSNREEQLDYQSLAGSQHPS